MVTDDINLNSIMDDKKEGIIIDPYCGSGTTLVAAKILGYDYTGIDISEEYIKYSKQRLHNYEKEIQAAKEELTKHKVTKTFKERKALGEFVGRHRNGVAIENKPEVIPLSAFCGVR